MHETNLYFAYGSNLCPRQMSERCPGAKPAGAGRLEGHRLVFPRRSVRWGGGVAGWASANEGCIEGALYVLREMHLEALDRLEGVAEGRYRRTVAEVRLADGAMHRVFTYEAAPEPRGPFPPTAAYLEAMIRGARHHGLSPAWIGMLEGWRVGGMANRGG